MNIGTHKSYKMKDIQAKSYDIVTYSIKSSRFQIRNYNNISQKKTLRYPANPCSEIQLTDIQQPTIYKYEIKTTNC